MRGGSWAERDARGWTNDSVASRMTAAGCTMASSAVWKIENEGRRITVDELLAFAQIFDIPVQELLLPPEIAASRRLIELATIGDLAYRRYWKASDEVRSAWEALQAHVQSGAAGDAAADQLAEAFGDVYHGDSETAVRDAEVARFRAELGDGVDVSADRSGVHKAWSDAQGDH